MRRLQPAIHLNYRFEFGPAKIVLLTGVILSFAAGELSAIGSKDFNCRSMANYAVRGYLSICPGYQLVNRRQTQSSFRNPIQESG